MFSLMLIIFSFCSYSEDSVEYDLEVFEHEEYEFTTKEEVQELVEDENYE
jgi:hypothetical protein